MQLSKYISELLLNHECVTVPALGSFISTFKSAHYDLSNEKFYPPSKIFLLILRSIKMMVF